MSKASAYYVYILASGQHGTLYIRITNNLRTRLEQHLCGRGSQFVSRYSVHRLVYVEMYSSPQEAIAREKQLKNWQRKWKIRLIEENNVNGDDLSQLL
jgi:putative endonuclease